MAAFIFFAGTKNLGFKQVLIIPVEHQKSCHDSHNPFPLSITGYHDKLYMTDFHNKRIKHLSIRHYLNLKEKEFRIQNIDIVITYIISIVILRPTNRDNIMRVGLLETYLKNADNDYLPGEDVYFVHILEEETERQLLLPRSSLHLPEISEGSNQMSGSLLELSTRDLLVGVFHVNTIYRISNGHFIEPFLLGDSNKMKFQSMSLIESEQQELIACSFSNKSVVFYALKFNKLDPVKIISFDFTPFKLLWMPSLEVLFVFNLKESNSIAAIMTESLEKMHEIQCETSIEVRDCCLLQMVAGDPIESISIIDNKTKSLGVYMLLINFDTAQ